MSLKVIHLCETGNMSNHKTTWLIEELIILQHKYDMYPPVL